MERRSKILIAAGMIGILLGLSLSVLLAPDSDVSKCQKIENGIKQNQSFNGSIACYPPGSIEVNLSERVENATDLQCVCRKIQDGNIQILPVAKSR